MTEPTPQDTAAQGQGEREALRDLRVRYVALWNIYAKPTYRTAADSDSDLALSLMTCDYALAAQRTPAALPASGAAQPKLQPVLEAMENLNGRALRDGGTVGLSWQIGLLRDAMAGHQGAGKMAQGGGNG